MLFHACAFVVTQLSFMVNVPAFGLARYTIHAAESNGLHSIASVMLYNSLPSHYGKGYDLLPLLLLLVNSCQSAATSAEIVKVLSLDITSIGSKGNSKY